MKRTCIIIVLVLTWVTSALAQVEFNSEDVKGPVKQVKMTMEIASPGAYMGTYGNPSFDKAVLITYYDSMGRLTKKEHFHGNELFNAIVRKYTKNTCIESSYDADGIQEGSYRIIRLDSAGHEISNWCYLNNKLFARDSTVYDSIGRIIQKYENASQKDSSWVLRNTYSYDSTGRIDSYKDWRNKSQYTIQYSPDGSYIMHYKNEKNRQTYKRKFKVNEKGQLVKIEDKNKRIYLSQFDQYGNWLQSKEETNTETPMGWITSITSREIEYYAESEFASPQIENDTIYSYAEQLPEFPGGQKAMFQYLADNVVYPLSAYEQGIQGRTTCQFVVNKSGSLVDVEVVKSSGNEELDAEAVRVISSMPKWTPGRLSGEIVRVKYTVPVTFKIAAPNPTNDSSVISTDTTVYTIVTQMPQFPGGHAALFDYLAKNIRYPSQAKRAKGSSVFVTFVVEKDGSLSNVVVARSSDIEWLDEEGVRLIKSMPKWEPGCMKGKVVRVRYAVPINVK